MTNNKLCLLSTGGQIFPKNESKHLPAFHQYRVYSLVHFFGWTSSQRAQQPRHIQPVWIIPQKLSSYWKIESLKGANILTLSICNWITGFSFPPFFSRLQGHVVRFWCCMRTGPSWPFQGRVCLQESGMSVFSGARLWFGLVDLLQRVRAGKSPVQLAATHQGAPQGALL